MTPAHVALIKILAAVAVEEFLAEHEDVTGEQKRQAVAAEIDRRAKEGRPCNQ